MCTIASAEQSSRNETKLKLMLFQMITFKMTCGFQHRYFSPPLMMLPPPPPPTEWKRIICSVRTWFRRELEAASWPSDRLEIYANSAQVGDPCRQPRRVITTRVVLWQPTDTCGTRVGPKSARFGLTTTCRMQNLHSSSSCWQRKQKTQKGAGHFWQGLAFVCRLGFHLLMCISHPSIHQSIRQSIHAFLHSSINIRSSTERLKNPKPLHRSWPLHRHDKRSVTTDLWAEYQL